MERLCKEEGVALRRFGLWRSTMYSVMHCRRTPVILINGQVICSGQVPREQVLRDWLKQAVATGLSPDR